MSTFPRSTIRAGIPQKNSALFHVTQFSVGDPVVYLDIENQGTTCLVRDVELDRALKAIRADRIAVPADFTPAGGLSADREVATAQAAAECLRRAGISEITADRTLPLSFAHVLRDAGIDVVCDLSLGVLERRQKSEHEIEMLRRSQAVTEEAVAMACEMIARSKVSASGFLISDGAALTSERVHAAINVFLMERGFSGPGFIVAGGPQGASCHHHGDGDLRTGEPVIVDIYPTSRKTHYCGDCTRTVVHGDIPDEVIKMHIAVRAAKAAGCTAIRPGITGAEVHAATTRELTDRGFHTGFPPEGAPLSYCTMHHGTGHGIGLDVHEPPLLDATGIELLKGDVLTVEPGLYRRDLGGVRVEDMIVVTENGIENLNHLPDGLDWK
ncbi:MAG: Xaa-Pro peptidase family protein [Verrucomicrobiales bacterium]|nr:Xaa-Pro peptidase family protein [Verrucomicrobiales bacterium]